RMEQLVPVQCYVRDDFQRRPKEDLKALERASASFKNTLVGIYKLLEDLRSQFELYESSHRCREGYCYSVVYPVHLSHLPSAQYSPLLFTNMPAEAVCSLR